MTTPIKESSPLDAHLADLLIVKDSTCTPSGQEPINGAFGGVKTQHGGNFTLLLLRIEWMLEYLMSLLAWWAEEMVQGLLLLKPFESMDAKKQQQLMPFGGWRIRVKPQLRMFQLLISFKVKLLRSSFIQEHWLRMRSKRLSPTCLESMTKSSRQLLRLTLLCITILTTNRWTRVRIRGLIFNNGQDQHPTIKQHPLVRWLLKPPILLRHNFIIFVGMPSTPTWGQSQKHYRSMAILQWGRAKS